MSPGYTTLSKIFPGSSCLVLLVQHFYTLDVTTRYPCPISHIHYSGRSLGDYVRVCKACPLTHHATGCCVTLPESTRHDICPPLYLTTFQEILFFYIPTYGQTFQIIAIITILYLKVLMSTQSCGTIL